MSKHLLINDFDYDFNTIGISCHAKDYRLCWSINNGLGVSLKKDSEIELTSRKGITTKHSCYHFFDEKSDKEYRLVSNKSQGSFLVK